MFLIRYSIVIIEFIPYPYNYLGFVFVILGLKITQTISSKFSKEATEIHTFKTPKKLVTTGWFTISRNPIYLGFTISLIGFWIFLGSVLPIVGCIAFVLITDRWYIPFEEKNLERIFGKDYMNYKTKVRRWL